MYLVRSGQRPRDVDSGGGGVRGLSWNAIHLSRWEFIAVSFMRREHIGQGIKPSSVLC